MKIDIICRGICSLRPGIPGVSDNVRVISVVDRFLEHSRIFYFENGGNPEVFVGTADWMDRNLSRRVEVVFPVEQPELKQRVIAEILKTTLADKVKARELQPDGTYKRVTVLNGEPGVRSQEKFLELARLNATRREPVPEVPAVQVTAVKPIRRAAPNPVGHIDLIEARPHFLRPPTHTPPMAASEWQPQKLRTPKRYF